MFSNVNKCMILLFCVLEVWYEEIIRSFFKFDGVMV